jgi:hypothetical protein
VSNLESSPPTTSLDQTEPTPKPSDPDLFATHPWSFDVTLGGGTPIGTFGVSVDRHLTPSLSIGGGLGVGSGPSGGAATNLHAGVFVRVRPVRSHKHALVIEGALSGGPYKRNLVLDGAEAPNSAGVSTNSAYFFQAALGWEKRSEKGLLVRLTAGAAVLLNPGNLHCVPETTYPSLSGSGAQTASTTCDAFSNGSKTEVVPTIAFTLGKAF